MKLIALPTTMSQSMALSNLASKCHLTPNLVGKIKRRRGGVMSKKKAKKSLVSPQTTIFLIVCY